MRKLRPDASPDAARWRSAELRVLEADGKGAGVELPSEASAGLANDSRVEAGSASASKGVKALRPALSLNGRALRLLSQREHSRYELARKLARFEPDADVINALLDSLEKGQWLSSERFVESVVNRRARGFGLRWIKQELNEHRLVGTDIEASLAGLRETEFDRALSLWRRRFGVLPRDLKERARQHRYLAARGFDGDIIAKVLRLAGSDTL